MVFLQLQHSPDAAAARLGRARGSRGSPERGNFVLNPQKGRAGQALFAFSGNWGAGGSPGATLTLELDPSGGWGDEPWDRGMTPGMGQGPQFQLGFLLLPCSGGSSRPLSPPRANPGKGDLGAGGLWNPRKSHHSPPGP